MATPAAANAGVVTPNTLITVKVYVGGSYKKLRLPLHELGPATLQGRIKEELGISVNHPMRFERYSDSAGAYTLLEPQNINSYKTLVRAAKAKLKLRLRVSELPVAPTPETAAEPAAQASFSPYTPGIKLVEPEKPESKTPIVPAQPQTWGPSDLGFHPPAFLPALASAPKEDAARVPTIVDEVPHSQGEAPVPDAFPARDDLAQKVADVAQSANLTAQAEEQPNSAPWSVYCNNCDTPISSHYHCSICDEGDYDLCHRCVDDGVHCPGDGHWLIKRTIVGGNVVSSTTEKIAPKPKPTFEKEMPGAYTEEKKAEAEPEAQEAPLATLTCNSCLQVFPAADCLTCTTCKNSFDLCVSCHLGGEHGHHPGHAYEPVMEGSAVGCAAEALCGPGRNVRHAAICDGCDKNIRGVRHKCLDCPDWDYCSACIKNASYIHPKHRFAPVYDPLPHTVVSKAVHEGICCDGPLCKNRSFYIYGVRYKCAVCHDTDFCANCEASPSNEHNRTHPLIKFKTPVKSVSVNTTGDVRGIPMPVLGDKPPRRSTATETAPAAASANASTQVQASVEKPVEQAAKKPAKEKIEIRDLLAEPIQEKSIWCGLPSPLQPKLPSDVKAEMKPQRTIYDMIPSVHLNAHFVSDVVVDGTRMPADTRFFQAWTLANPGPCAWPAGTSVRFVGGDNMLNVDNVNPSSARDMANATESNATTSPVQVGESFTFRIVMKTPQRAGRAISYWRLKTAGGVPFGHRLWCDINVTYDAVLPPVHQGLVADAHRPLPISTLAAGLIEQQQTAHQLNMQKAGTAAPSDTRLFESVRYPYSWMAQEPDNARLERQALAEKQQRPLAVADYQMQLLLLEAENKKRLALARQHQAKVDGAANAHAKALTQALLEVSSQKPEPSVSGSVEPKIESPSEPPAPESVSEPAAEKEVTKGDEEVKEVKEANEVKSEASTMIFPQLDKESPVTSQHEASVTAVESAKSSDEESDLFVDAESLDLADAVSNEDEDDDPFLTDEEYDILDASDEELL